MKEKFTVACFVAQAVLIWLKTTGIIEWRWRVVFAPVWILLAAAIMLLLVAIYNVEKGGKKWQGR